MFGKKKKKSLDENQIRTVWAVFGELKRIPYHELNRFLGSITIKEMVELHKKLDDWIRPNVLNQIYVEGIGWVDRDADF